MATADAILLVTANDVDDGQTAVIRTAATKKYLDPEQVPGAEAKV